MFEYNTSGDDKISRIKDSLDSTKNIMVQNIETVLNRGEKLEVLVEKAEDLNDTSMTFRDSNLLHHMFWFYALWVMKYRTKLTLVFQSEFKLELKLHV